MRYYPQRKQKLLADLKGDSLKAWLSGACGSWLPDIISQCGHSFRWRSTTYSSGNADRLQFDGRSLCPGRAVIGLHQRDNSRLIETLKKLRDLGNTLIVVEHDEETIRSSDHVLDIGPGAGIHGGFVVAEGTPEEIEKNPVSLTGQYLLAKR